MKTPLRTLGLPVALVAFAMIGLSPVGAIVAPAAAATEAPMKIDLTVVRACPTATPKDDPGKSAGGADPDKGKAVPHAGECATPSPGPTPTRTPNPGIGGGDVIGTETPTPAPTATPTPSPTPSPTPTKTPHPDKTG